MKRAQRAQIYIDGACSGNPGPAGIGVVIFLEGAKRPTRQLSVYLGEATNNIAEYLALVYALQEAVQLGCHVLTVRTDSELLVRQVEGRYKVRDGTLRILHGLVRRLMGVFQSVQLQHIPRTDNGAADRLARQAVASRSPAADTAELFAH
jgi:ribonuclease HI